MDKNQNSKNLSKLTEIDRRVLLAYSSRMEQETKIYTTEAASAKEIRKV